MQFQFTQSEHELTVNLIGNTQAVCRSEFLILARKIRMKLRSLK